MGSNPVGGQTDKSINEKGRNIYWKFDTSNSLFWIESNRLLEEERMSAVMRMLVAVVQYLAFHQLEWSSETITVNLIINTFIL